MPEGGTLRFTTRCEDGNVVVRVSDTGTGMDRETVSKIFDPFFTTKEKSKGTGLGLFIVRSVARRYGGDAYAESAGEGQGSTFFVRLPRVYRA